LSETSEISFKRLGIRPHSLEQRLRQVDCTGALHGLVARFSSDALERGNRQETDAENDDRDQHLDEGEGTL
jgi:hypothetical protein